MEASVCRCILEAIFFLSSQKAPLIGRGLTEKVVAGEGRDEHVLETALQLCTRVSATYNTLHLHFAINVNIELDTVRSYCY